jgi:hypothetical protein
VSTAPYDDRLRPSEIAAGLLAAISLTASVVAVAYEPVKLAPFAILVGLIAAGLGGRNSRLATAAVAAGTIAWLIGMTIAVLLSRPLY